MTDREFGKELDALSEYFSNKEIDAKIVARLCVSQLLMIEKTYKIPMKELWEATRKRFEKNVEESTVSN